MDSGTGQVGIAVVGIGCWYPGAQGPRQLWENIVARRRQFRRMPAQRLPLEQYHDADPAAPDKTYGRRAAVIDGFAFDWAGARIPRATYESTDFVQWLALDVARQALADAGYNRDSATRERTGVLVGNTLTGEHTRANTMRLRWPYVERALRTSAARRGLSGDVVDGLVATMEHIFKSSFAPVTEDTLAGGLSNTIAGRICNFFDFHGGGYTVDGACASSLLAVCNAADQLANGTLDLALAGGVDISLDTFELIGFAKTGALSPDEMRVYDRRANGFIPGEGCGFVVLKRLDDAEAAGDAIYAVIRGWGISSDGKGGLTAPSRDGQATALRRAYARAGYSPTTLDFVEGHGTGTRVGDRVELEAVDQAIRAEGGVAPRSCGMTSFKSLVGHTKAAAGVGALIKATLAVNRRVLPPTAGCTEPSAVFASTATSLYPILRGAVAEPTRTLRAGVSAMGFGGINAHVTLESGPAPLAKVAPALEERALLASHQESELFVLGAETIEELVDRLVPLARTAEQLSIAELTDLAAQLARELSGSPPIRAVVVAGAPDELAEQLRALATAVLANPPAPSTVVSGPRYGWSVSNRAQTARIGFLFPGQGSQQLQMARTLVERFGWARELVARAESASGRPLWRLIDRPTDRAVDDAERERWSRELAQTEVAQPAICLASLLHARHLEHLGVRPAVVAGHSLGELTAFCRAGAFGEDELLALATAREQAMAAPADQPGAMASLACANHDAEALIAPLGGAVSVANRNSPRQTVLSGDEAGILEAVRIAAERGIPARRLPVSNAFHTPRVALAAETFRNAAPWPETRGRFQARLFSSTTGCAVEPGTDLPTHFAAQMVAQVDFVGLVTALRQECDLMIEVGPGAVLSGLVSDIVGADGPACLPVAGRAHADRDLNVALGQAFVRGTDVRWNALYEGRLVRPFVAADDRLFIDNPCERPFPEASADESVPAGAFGALEATLLEATGASPEALQGYLAQRGPFLAEVVKADLQMLPAAARAPEAAAAAAPAPAPVSVAEVAEDVGLESLLLDMAAQQTGFARASIGLETRLLDDLNLDSIKAAELVASAAKQRGVAGRLDPSALANASLAEVAAAIRAAEGSTAPDAPVARPKVAEEPLPFDEAAVWVRDFVIEYVHEAA